MSDTPDDWNDIQRALFDRLFRHMLDSQAAFTHPRAEPVPIEHWETTCWNAAWMAAKWCLDPQGAPRVVHEHLGAVIAIETTGAPS